MAFFKFPQGTGGRLEILATIYNTKHGSNSYLIWPILERGAHHGGFCSIGKAVSRSFRAFRQWNRRAES